MSEKNHKPPILKTLGQTNSRTPPKTSNTHSSPHTPFHSSILKLLMHKILKEYTIVVFLFDTRLMYMLYYILRYTNREIL